MSMLHWVLSVFLLVLVVQYLDRRLLKAKCTELERSNRTLHFRFSVFKKRYREKIEETRENEDALRERIQWLEAFSPGCRVWMTVKGEVYDPEIQCAFLLGDGSRVRRFYSPLDEKRGLVDDLEFREDALMSQERTRVELRKKQIREEREGKLRLVK